MFYKIPEGCDNLIIQWMGEIDGEDEFKVTVDVQIGFNINPYVDNLAMAKYFVDVVAKEYENQFTYKKDGIRVIRNRIVVP